MSDWSESATDRDHVSEIANSSPDLDNIGNLVKSTDAERLLVVLRSSGWNVVGSREGSYIRLKKN